MSASSNNLAMAIDKVFSETKWPVSNKIKEGLEKEIVDFLSERFTIARMNANVDQEISLRCLWNDLTNDGR